MSDNVFDLGAFRQKKVAETAEKPTIEQLAHGARERTDFEWEKFARSNRLNDYFTSSLPSWANQTVNYLQDLNEVGMVETKVGLVLKLRAPWQSVIGWRAGFVMKGGEFETPDMPFESYARCFNILFYLRLRRELTNHGLSELA